MVVGNGDGDLLPHQEAQIKAVPGNRPGGKAVAVSRQRLQGDFPDGFAAAEQHIDHFCVGAFRQLPGAGDAAAEGAGNHFPAGFLALQPGIHPGDEVAGAVLNVADVQRRHVGVDGLLGAGILVGRHVIPEPAETKQRQSQKEQGIYRHDNQQFDAVFHFSAGSHAVSPSLRTTKEVGMGRMPMTEAELFRYLS